jgi:hypothetical protein
MKYHLIKKLFYHIIIKMFRTTLVFLFGVYIGQEYGDVLPSVKGKTYEVVEKMTQTAFYKKLENEMRQNYK